LFVASVHNANACSSIARKPSIMARTITRPSASTAAQCRASWRCGAQVRRCRAPGKADHWLSPRRVAPPRRAGRLTRPPSGAARFAGRAVDQVESLSDERNPEQMGLHVHANIQQT
jgi:hypothetical protein